MKHTIVFGGSQFTRCIPLSRRQAKIKNQAGFLCSTSLHYFSTSKSWLQIWWRVNQPFLKYTFFITSNVNSTMTCCFFIVQTSDRIFFFFALFKPIILPFCSILQDKLHSFKYYIQDDRSTRFFCTTNYSIDHIIKRFHEANSMPRLFS